MATKSQINKISIFLDAPYIDSDILKFHFPTFNCFDIVLEKSTEWYLLLSLCISCLKSLMIQIHYFLTDLAQIWYRGLVLGANSKSKAILWIRG